MHDGKVIFQNIDTNANIKHVAVMLLVEKHYELSNKLKT
jgi:hypothetical protein